MPKTVKETKSLNHKQIHKCPTGIKGFDEITEGGLPKNRNTLISRKGPALGKTLLGDCFFD